VCGLFLLEGPEFELWKCSVCGRDNYIQVNKSKLVVKQL
jgi:hypothetical protein